MACCQGWITHDITCSQYGQPKESAKSPIDLLDAAEAHVRTMAACAARDRALELLSIAMGEVLAELPESERYA